MNVLTFSNCEFGSELIIVNYKWQLAHFNLYEIYFNTHTMCEAAQS